MPAHPPAELVAAYYTQASNHTPAGCGANQEDSK
jgi:hypothetical protein